MNENARNRSKRVAGVRFSVSAGQLLCLLLVAVLGVVYVYPVPAVARKPRIYPPQEIATGYLAYDLFGRREGTSSSVGESLRKDERPGAVARRRRENIEYQLGPMEIGEDETLGEATRVVVPILSAKYRDWSTGKITEVTSSQGPLIGKILERRDLGDGLGWQLVEGKQKYDIIMSDWYKLPRKKVEDSPTIILKKAVVVQVIFEGKVASEKVIFADDPNSR
jgi:hypothetical protein